MLNPSLPFKPLLLKAVHAHKKGLIKYDKKGTAFVKLPGGKIAQVPPQNQYDLTRATIFGLNERLTMSSNSPVLNKNGKTLREAFNQEWEKYTQALADFKNGYLNYGVYAYYEENNDLVRFCEPFWHHVVSVASSSMLLSHKNKKMPWQETRQVLSSTNIAVAGCSVGNSIIHGTVMDLRPKNIKIADKSLYKMENINRVRLGYWEIVEPNSKSASAQDLLLKNKANVTASQLYAIDPYINVFIYNEGINENNISRFLKGGGNEPAADFLVEEVDDPRVKVLLRTYAKKYRIPLLMVTDLGSSIQLDILRFDQNSKLPLTFKNTDAKLIKSMETVYEDPGNRKTFFNFVDQLIGRDYRQDELKEIIEQKTEIPTSTIIPQLGSTIMAAGGIMAEAIARIRLGYNYPPRLIFNKHTFKLKIYR